MISLMTILIRLVRFSDIVLIQAKTDDAQPDKITANTVPLG